MRTKWSVVFLQLIFISEIYGNVDCIWSNSKSGIFIEYVATCKQKNNVLVDSILNNLVSKLQRVDTTLKIEIYVNSEDLFYRETKNLDFVSISYDLLGKLKSDEIFNYYYDTQNSNFKYDTRKTPLNINYKKEEHKKGLKIIFNTDFRKSIKWEELYMYVNYAVKNIEKIKRIQKLDTIGFCCNYYFISLLTIDSAKIKEIIMPKQNAINNDSKTQYYVIGLIILLTFIFSINKLRQLGFGRRR